MSSTYLSLQTHIVFSTKGRVPLIDGEWIEALHGYLAGATKGLGAVPLAVGGAADHVHLLAAFRANHCVSDFVRELKKASHDWASERRRGFAWQRGYGAFSVSYREIGVVSDYIRHQEEHHRHLSSAEELLAFLEEHGVGYDQKYFE